MSIQDSDESPVFQGRVWGVLPPDFPMDRAEAVYRRFIVEMGSGTIACRLMGGGFKGVAYRYKAMVCHGQDLEESIKTNGLTPPVEIHFEQEHSIFSFFVTGLSALECFFFALHSIGAYYAPDRFKLDPKALRDVNPELVAKNLNEEWPEALISLVSCCLVDSDKYKLWKRVRNTVTHRVVPSRAITLVSGGPNKVIWQFEEAGFEDGNQTINEATLSQRREWLALQFQELWSALEYFTP